MRKLIIALSIIFQISNLNAQQKSITKIKEGIFYTKLESGAGIDIPCSFTIDKETLNKIKTIEHYKEFCKDKKYIQEQKKAGVNDTLAMYLFSECVGYNFITKYKTKKPLSYSVIADS